MSTRESVKAVKKRGDDLEIWESAIPGTIVLRRLDNRGEFAAEETVGAGRKCHITTEERIMNQELVAAPQFDVFSNGMMRPVRLIDSAEDAREIAANPNLMTEGDMRQLVQAHPKALGEKLVQIQNAVTLQRLLAIANDENVAVKSVRAIEGRLAEVNSQGGLLSEVAGGGRQPVIPSFGGPRRPRATSPR